LDMRQDRRQSLTAGDVVNGYPGAALEHVLRELGEERFARRIAAAIVAHRTRHPLVTTRELAAVVESVVPRRPGKSHPATRTFQALRMEVNDELGALEHGLRVLTARLEIGARIAVITFHSLEDRIVKNFFRDRSRELLDRPEWPEPRPNPDFSLRIITSKPVEAGENEQRINPRSRSAKLRVAERV